MLVSRANSTRKSISRSIRLPSPIALHFPDAASESMVAMASLLKRTVWWRASSGMSAQFPFAVSTLCAESGVASNAMLIPMVTLTGMSLLLQMIWPYHDWRRITKPVIAHSIGQNKGAELGTPPLFCPLLRACQ